MFKRFRTAWYGPFGIDNATGEFDHAGFEAACKAIGDANAMALETPTATQFRWRKRVRFGLAICLVLALTVVVSALANSQDAPKQIANWQVRSSVSETFKDTVPTFTVELSVDRRQFSSEGEIVNFRFDVINTSDGILTGKIVLGDSHVLTRCASVPRRGIGPQEKITCTGKLSITRADLATGEIRHTFAALHAKGLSYIYEAVLCSKFKNTACQDESDFICSQPALNTSKRFVRNYCRSSKDHPVARSNSSCLSISGSVYKDYNRNGTRDQAEDGVMFAELYSSSGKKVRTDKDGNYSLACAEVSELHLIDNGDLKLDANSLPEGYAATGSMQNLKKGSGGAIAIHFPVRPPRIIRLDLKGEAFVKGTTVLRSKWRSELPRLLTLLQTEPAILQLAYDTGPDQLTLAQDRVRAVKDVVKKQWSKQPVSWKLIIESHIQKRLQQAEN